MPPTQFGSIASSFGPVRAQSWLLCRQDSTREQEIKEVTTRAYIGFGGLSESANFREELFGDLCGRRLLEKLGKRK